MLNQAINRITMTATHSSTFPIANNESKKAYGNDNEQPQVDGDEKEVDDMTLQYNLQLTEESFRQEIRALEEACHQHEIELQNLYTLRDEQIFMEQDLSDSYDHLCQVQNDLELEAIEFEHDQQQYTKNLTILQNELDAVAFNTAISLPTLLYDLQVDEQRGLRFPLINDLRLAYRPKNDIQWDEIQIAWSLAAQLLLVVGTIFEFQSKHCKIIPLTQCAKLIYYPPTKTQINDTTNTKAATNLDHHARTNQIVYNLGHPSTNMKRALITWNALLCQLTQYVQHKMQEACEVGIFDESYKVPNLPFPITSTKIGNIILTQLDEIDDTSWSQAIHYVASNMKWLSECASVYILNEVQLII